MEKRAIASMRLFANWEVDRASSSSVQRVFCVSITRLFLKISPLQTQNVVLTARLQGHKRNLRSNEIPAISNASSDFIDINLDVSFTIQYPHFLKGKDNILQIMIQRKRKYKNRPIPGGFKTLAVGTINLTNLLQQGGLREIVLWNAEVPLKNIEATEVHSIGLLEVANCNTSPLDYDVDRERVSKKRGVEGEISEDDSDSEYDDLPIDSEINEPASARKTRNMEMRHKLRKRKNLKQKFVNLLRKFRVPEDEGLAASTSASVVGAPTAKELEALFEELENMSDSGPEMAADEISISSNPRPVLLPYFTRSRERLPSIYDDRDADIQSDSEVDGEDAEWSSEENGGKFAERINEGTAMYPTSSQSDAHSKHQMRIGSTSSAPLTYANNQLSLPHSLTTGSISPKKLDKSVNIVEQVNHLLANDCCIWLCSPDAVHLHALNLPIVQCASLADAKQILLQVVARIHKFCNSNAVNPPISYVGILGGDRLIGQVVRAYVDCLHHKSYSNWLQYLRFIMVPPTHSIIGRLVSGIEPSIDTMSREIWERWSELSPMEMAHVVDLLENWPTKAEGCLNLPIGEAMLQMTEATEGETGPIFVPFLAEVRVGQPDEEAESHSPRIDDKDIRDGPSGGGNSPPCSPHSRQDVREMNVEYWLGKENPHEPFVNQANTSTTPSSRKDTKGTMKTTFRNLMISRSCHHPLLSLTFVKEKRKDKMLQKLGMKKGQKSDSDAMPVQVASVARLLCSGVNKNSELNVSIDGSSYRGVRYFQTSAQWPTHIKSFPLSLIKPYTNFTLSS